MADDITFLDLMALTNIKDDTVVERFGGMINSSFFDASNILGALKIKGLIDFTTALGGQNAITITESGRKLLSDSSEKAKLPFDQLDMAILIQLSGGKRSLADLGGAINITPFDMAMHLYKVQQQQYTSSNFRNGIIEMMLTEKGYMAVNNGKAGSGGAKEGSAAAEAAGADPVGATPGQNVGKRVDEMAAAEKPAEGAHAPAEQKAGEPPKVENGLKAVEAAIKKKNEKKMRTIAAVVAIVIVVLALKVAGII